MIRSYHASMMKRPSKPAPTPPRQRTLDPTTLARVRGGNGGGSESRNIEFEKLKND
jgi:hypothetical protein